MSDGNRRSSGAATDTPVHVTAHDSHDARAS